MTTIVQICPEIAPGSGVGGVAYHLEKEWKAQGVTVERFTLEDVFGSWIPRLSGGLAGKLALLVRVLWFSTAGTLLARQKIRGRSDVISVCHNDAMVGDIYVNHGIVQAAMRARGGYWWRMARNPLHLFTAWRDRMRYSGRAGHRLVVNLVAGEEQVLRRTYRSLSVPTVVIGNGVDVERFTVPTSAERDAERRRLGVTGDDQVLLFVGHEFDRKGLRVVIDALDRLPPETHLVVVGGTHEMIQNASQPLHARGLGGRVHFVGAQPDPRPYFRAADVFVLPSAYESHALVILEALACGVPVVATPTGSAPDVLRDGVNGYVVEADAGEMADRIRRLRDRPRLELQKEARTTAEQHSWARVAQNYLDVMTAQLSAHFTEAR